LKKAANLAGEIISGLDEKVKEPAQKNKK